MNISYGTIYNFTHFKSHRGGNFQDFNPRISALIMVSTRMMQVQKLITPFNLCAIVKEHAKDVLFFNIYPWQNGENNSLLWFNQFMSHQSHYNYAHIAQ